MKSGQKIAIVGGGWAGIACAVELADHGIPVTLFEAAKQLGGRARGLDWDGLKIDNGQHLMIGAYRETLRLLTRLNTVHKLERRPLELNTPDFHLRLRLLPAPLHLAVGLLFARGLSLSEKRAAARFMQRLKSINYTLPTDCPVSQYLEQQNQTAPLIARLWAPICLAALNTPLEQASAQVFCNVLRDSLAGTRSNSDVLINRADLNVLVAAAATALLAEKQSDIKTGCKIQQIVRQAEGFYLQGPNEIYTQLVVATHPARLPALLAPLPELADTLSQVSDFTWQPILTLWLHFSAPLPFSFPMLGLGDSTAPWAFERNDIAPGIVALVVSAEGPHLALPEKSLRDKYLRLLAGRLGPLPKLLNWKTIIEKRATYACVPNMSRPENHTPLEGLYLAGDYTREMNPTNTYPATLEGAVRSGVKCAHMIIANPNRS